jgi:thiol:disulfide interchange protein
MAKPLSDRTSFVIAPDGKILLSYTDRNPKRISENDGCGETVRKFALVKADVNHPISHQRLTMLTAMLAAFAGGIILNFMPCVFPIISKALGLVRHSHSTVQTRKNLASYSARLLPC